MEVGEKRGELIKESKIFAGRQIPQGVVIPGVAGDKGIERRQEKETRSHIPYVLSPLHIYFSFYSILLAFTFKLIGREDHMFSVYSTAVYCHIINGSTGK